MPHAAWERLPKLECFAREIRPGWHACGDEALKFAHASFHEVRESPFEQTSYRLVGVLLYSHRYHFIADVYDPHELRWLRYDANFNGGIGVTIEPPSGRPEHKGHSYYAVALAYVCVVATPPAPA